MFTAIGLVTSLTVLGHEDLCSSISSITCPRATIDDLVTGLFIDVIPCAQAMATIMIVDDCNVIEIYCFVG
jgi:hypothetical protein